MIIIFSTLKEVCQSQSKAARTKEQKAAAAPSVIKLKLIERVLDCTKLTHVDSRVMVRLICHYNIEDGCFPSLETLMHELGIGERTLLRCIRKLKEIGLLAVQKRYKRGKYRLSNLYHINWLCTQVPVNESGKYPSGSQAST